MLLLSGKRGCQWHGIVGASPEAVWVTALMVFDTARPCLGRQHVMTTLTDESSAGLLADLRWVAAPVASP
jgi:hypothetical protein